MVCWNECAKLQSAVARHGRREISMKKKRKVRLDKSCGGCVYNLYAYIRIRPAKNIYDFRPRAPHLYTASSTPEPEMKIMVSLERAIVITERAFRRNTVDEKLRFREKGKFVWIKVVADVCTISVTRL